MIKDKEETQGIADYIGDSLSVGRLNKIAHCKQLIL